MNPPAPMGFGMNIPSFRGNISTIGTIGSITSNAPTASKIPWMYIAFTVVVAITIGLISYFIIKSRKSVPLAEGFLEHHQGITAPINARLSDEGSLLYNTFEKAAAQTEQGRADLQELGYILEKLAAIRADLTVADKKVNITATLPYITTHDREPVSEMVARCFAKTMPERDLDIAFETLRNRGQALVYRLSSAAGLDSATSAQKFAAIWDSTYSVAKSECLVGELAISGKAVSPREAIPYDAGIEASPIL